MAHNINKGKIAIYQSKDGSTSLRVKLQEETVWLTQKDIAQLFGTKIPAISKHLANIFKAQELSRKSTVSRMETVQLEGNRNIKRISDFYNLDAIIAVGYRVNSKRATQFRIWATVLLKDHLIKGYTMNQKRLSERGLAEFEQAVKLMKRTMEEKSLTTSETSGLLKIITDYAHSWLLLQGYDKGDLIVKKTAKELYEIDYKNALEGVDILKKELIAKDEATIFFGKEREGGFSAILGSIYQTFEGKELYPSVEQKAAHLLYLTIKDHSFIDGNKRIGSFLFIVFLAKNKFLLKENGEQKITDNTLVALALLIAQSNPKEKNMIIKLITNFL